MRMLVTRPEPDASATALRLGALGIEPVTAPLMRLLALETDLPGPEGFSAIALTSANGLRALAGTGRLAPYLDLPVHAVGPHSAEEARAAGFAIVHEAGGRLADLVVSILGSSPEGRIFHPAGRHLTGDLVRSAGEGGVHVETVPVYEMVPIALEPSILKGLASGAFGAALVYSRRSAQLLAGAALGLDPAARARIEMLCLSEAVAEPLLEAHFTRIGLAERPDEDAMMALALAFARGQNRA